MTFKKQLILILKTYQFINDVNDPKHNRIDKPKWAVTTQEEQYDGKRCTQVTRNYGAPADINWSLRKITDKAFNNVRKWYLNFLYLNNLTLSQK